jgi:hypothetical protein
MTTFAILRERSDLFSNPHDTARRSRLSTLARPGHPASHALLDDAVELQIESEDIRADIDRLARELAPLRQRAAELAASAASRDRAEIAYRGDGPMEIDVYSHSLRRGVDAADFVALSGERDTIHEQLAKYRAAFHRQSIEELIGEIACGAREVYELSAQCEADKSSEIARRKEIDSVHMSESYAAVQAQRKLILSLRAFATEAVAAHAELKREFERASAPDAPPEVAELSAEYRRALEALAAAKDRYLALRDEQMRELRAAQAAPQAARAPAPPPPKQRRRARRPPAPPPPPRAEGRQIEVGPFVHPISAARVRAGVVKFGRVTRIDVRRAAECRYSAIVTFERREAAEKAAAAMESGDPRYKTFRIAPWSPGDGSRQKQPKRADATAEKQVILPPAEPAARDSDPEPSEERKPGIRPEESGLALSLSSGDRDSESPPAAASSGRSEEEGKAPGSAVGRSAPASPRPASAASDDFEADSVSLSLPVHALRGVASDSVSDQLSESQLEFPGPTAAPDAAASLNPVDAVPESDGIAGVLDDSSSNRPLADGGASVVGVPSRPGDEVIHFSLDDDSDSAA